jgi:hypothetical protein
MKMSFPFWQFLNQPVFSSSYKLILNPQRFWHVHKVEVLERCWSKAYEPEGRR